MITRKTVFILGAGASMPYGFPTGEWLIKEIVSLTRNNPSKPIFMRDEFINTNPIEFSFNLQESRCPSIDTFLGHRPEFLDIGKLAIAMTLAVFENDAAFHQPNTDAGPWYGYLWQEMMPAKGDFGKNAVSFITFNYDRSLERCFFLSLKALHRYQHEDEVLAELKAIPIVHIHGALGDPEFREHPYRINHTEEELVEISKRLKIISQDPSGNPQFEEAKALIHAADRVCFLGYGFHEANNAGLGLREFADPAVRRQHDKKWFTSSFGLTEAEFNRRTSGFTHLFANQVGGQFNNALAVLRQLPVLG